MRAGKPEQYYRVNPVRPPSLSTEDERALFTDYHRYRTPAKRDRVVRQYLYWAAELACRYGTKHISKADAISAANFGLMEAIERFDPKAGRRFVTFSYFAIRREVIAAVRASYVIDPTPGLDAARYQFNTSPKTEDDDKRLRQARVKVFTDIARTLAMNGGTSGGADVPPGEKVGKELQEDDARPEIENASLLEALKAALPSLPAEWRRVVELRYFNDGKPLTLVEIGHRLNCTADHARWLHALALKHLRKTLRPVKKEI